MSNGLDRTHKNKSCGEVQEGIYNYIYSKFYNQVVRYEGIGSSPKASHALKGFIISFDNIA